MTEYNHLMNGPYYEWCKNGKLKTEGIYNDKVPTVLKEWDENGVLINEIDNSEEKKTNQNFNNEEFYVVMMHTEFMYESYNTDWSFDELILKIESNKPEVSKLLIKHIKEKLNCEYVVFTQIKQDDGDELLRVLDLPKWIEPNEYMDGPRFGPFKTLKGLEDFILSKKTIEFNDEKIEKHFCDPLDEEEELDIDENEIMKAMEFHFCMLKAWDKMEEGNYSGALVDILASINLKSNSTNNDTAAMIYFYLENFKKALEHSNESIKMDETISENFYNRAQILVKLGKTGKAIKDLKKAIDLDSFEDAKKLLEQIT